MFQLESLTLKTLTEIRPLLGAIERADRDLGRQLRRAGSSMLLNVSESVYVRGARRREQLRVAAGSANEVRAALRLAEAWGYVEAGSVAAVLERLDHCIAVLWKLMR
ncbi:MAG: four helix bundle protein [Myxococcales bacterium]|nr:four helix bundle protein [Myxococcales bacterium]